MALKMFTLLPMHYIEIVNKWRPARISRSSSSSSPGGRRDAAASGQSAVIIYTPADLGDLQTMNWADIQHRAVPTYAPTADVNQMSNGHRGWP